MRHLPLSWLPSEILALSCWSEELSLSWACCWATTSSWDTRRRRWDSSAEGNWLSSRSWELKKWCTSVGRCKVNKYQFNQTKEHQWVILFKDIKANWLFTVRFYWVSGERLALWYHVYGSLDKNIQTNNLIIAREAGLTPREPSISCDVYALQEMMRRCWEEQVRNFNHTI